MDEDDTRNVLKDSKKIKRQSSMNNTITEIKNTLEGTSGR